MSNRFLAIFAIPLLLVSSVAPVLSQAQPVAQPTPATQEQDETIRVGTAAVQIEAIVTDKNGRRVSGLSAADFQVLDEGVPQTLDYFTAIEGSRVRQAEGDAAKGDSRRSNNSDLMKPPVSPLINPYQGRHIALVFDDLNLSAENFLRVRRALTEYVEAKLTSNDLVALISTRGLTASLQQFTNDRQRLLSAIDRIAAQGVGPNRATGGRKFNITPAEAARIDSGDERVLDAVVQRVSTESLANQLGAGSSTFADGAAGEAARRAEADALRTQVRGEARSIISQSGVDTRNFLNTLANLFRGMGDLPGRKIVVLVTESFTTLGRTTEDVSNQLVQITELARRSGVSVYGLDAGGLRTNSTAASEYVTASGLQIRNTVTESTYTDFENFSAARKLVAGTGGELIVNTNDLTAGLDRAVEDSSNYYVVGFKPRALDNKFHRLTVSVKGQPDLIVRTRRGYLAVNQETVRGTNTEFIAALMSPVPRLDLPLDIVVNVLPKGGAQTTTIALHVGRNYLSLPAATAADKKAVYEVVAWVFATGRDQPITEPIDRAVEYDLANSQAQQKLKTEGFLYVDTLKPLPPGLYQIRAVVREKTTGVLGSAYQFFEVPDAANNKVISLSSLVLTVPGQTGFSGYYNFKRGTEVEMRYIIYNLPKDSKGLVQRVRLLDDAGRGLMEGALPFAPPAGGDLKQALQGTRVKMPPTRGRYALIISLRDEKGKIDIERRVDFIVE